MDRRSLLKSAAALSAAAMTPVTAAVSATVAETISTQAQIVPLKANPYTNYVWEWFVSHDGETYYEGFATKEEALEYAKRSEYSLIAECIQQDFRLEIDGGEIIERLNDDQYDLRGEGEGIECTREQERDLGKMLTKALEAWVVKHNINITAWSFDGVRNETDVPEPTS